MKIEYFLNFLFSVSSGDAKFKEDDVDETNCYDDNGDNISPVVDTANSNGNNSHETLSVDFPNGHLVQKPKTGFLQKFNLALSRMFKSKL